MALGSDLLMEPDAAAKALQISRDYVAPDALDMAYQGVARSWHFERAAQWMDDYLAKSDLLLRKAEPRGHTGGASPGAFVPVLGLQNASSSREDKSLVLATLRRILGCCSGGWAGA